MFENIYREMAARGRMSITTLSRKIGISPKSLSNKLNGRTEFTRREMIEVQKILGGIPLDILFFVGENEKSKLS